MELHWQLPMASAEKNSTGYIHGNAKVHLFIDSYDSVCGRYEQDVNYYDDADESEINERDCCKKCWKKYIELTENRGIKNED